MKPEAEKKNLSKSKRLVPLLLVISSIFIMIGTSFALWQLTFRQTDTNIITTDCFKLTFEGENDINIENAYPMTYDELESYLPTAVPFHFTITNVCDSRSSVTINLETLGVEGKQLADKYIEFVLYDGSKQYVSGIQKFNEHSNALEAYPLNNENKVIEEAVDAYELYTFTLKENTSKEFNLLLYLDPDTPAIDEVMNALWQGKITISATHIPAAKNYMVPMKINCWGTVDITCDTLTYTRPKDTSYELSVISFEDTISPYDNAVETVDFSNAKDNSVLGYYIKDEGQDTYSLHIQANGKITANKDGKYYFSSKSTRFVGLENVDMSYSESAEGLFQNSVFDTLDMSILNLSNVENIGKNTNESMFKKTTINELYFSKPFSLNTTSLSNMFPHSNITNINLTNLNTSKVSDMHFMFLSSKANSINLGDINTSNVTNMESMFEECLNLTSLDLSNIDTSKVTTMHNMFAKDSKLTNLNLSGLNTSSVTNMGYMFNSCIRLTDLDLSSFDTSNVTNMQYMFYACSSLTALDLSSFDTSSVIEMSYMFASDSNLTSINYGTKFIRKSYSIISSMFSNCPANKPTDTSWNGAF